MLVKCQHAGSISKTRPLQHVTAQLGNGKPSRNARHHQPHLLHSKVPLSATYFLARAATVNNLVPSQTSTAPVLTLPSTFFPDTSPEDLGEQLRQLDYPLDFCRWVCDSRVTGREFLQLSVDDFPADSFSCRSIVIKKVFYAQQCWALYCEMLRSGENVKSNAAVDDSTAGDDGGMTSSSSSTSSLSAAALEQFAVDLGASKESQESMLQLFHTVAAQHGTKELSFIDFMANSKAFATEVRHLLATSKSLRRVVGLKAHTVKTILDEMPSDDVKLDDQLQRWRQPTAANAVDGVATTSGGGAAMFLSGALVGAILASVLLIFLQLSLVADFADSLTSSPLGEAWDFSPDGQDYYPFIEDGPLLIPKEF